jgi:type I restriction enzyme, S subunit
VPHISSNQVEAARIFVPSVTEQTRIVHGLEKLLKICDMLEASLGAAETTRSRLLNAVITEALNSTALQAA